MPWAAIWQGAIKGLGAIRKVANSRRIHSNLPHWGDEGFGLDEDTRTTSVYPAHERTNPPEYHRRTHGAGRGETFRPQVLNPEQHRGPLQPPQ